jgi:molecular chaperone GrpE
METHKGTETHPGMEIHKGARPPGAPQVDSETDGHARVVAELEDRWRRTLADLDNLRKRYARQLAEQQVVERARVTSAWLPVLDNLELALQHAAGDPASIVEGVRAVRDQAVNLLDSLGYTRHDETGVAFDPSRHEAISVLAAQAPPGTVLEVLRAGYGDADRQLRPAAVVVAADRE